MPEYRHDSILDRRVIVAAERATRPHTTTLAPELRGGSETCPFCPGHEHETPPETHRIGPGAPDTPMAPSIWPPPSMTMPPPRITTCGRPRIPLCALPGCVSSTSALVLLRKLTAVQALPRAVAGVCGPA